MHDSVKNYKVENINNSNNTGLWETGLITAVRCNRFLMAFDCAV